MAISVVTWGSGTGTGTNAAVVTAASLPGMQDDDIMVAHFFVNSNSYTPTMPDGFTAWISGNHMGARLGILAWKRAASESGNYSFTTTTGSITKGAQITVFRGCIATGDPLDGAVSDTAYTTSNTICRAASLDVVTEGAALVWCGNSLDTTAAIVSPDTFTDSSSLRWGAYAYQRMATKLGLSPGATGVADGTLGSNQTAKYAFMAALKPLVVSGPFSPRIIII